MTFGLIAALALALALASAWVALGGRQRAVAPLAAFVILAGLGRLLLPSAGRVFIPNLTILHEGGTGRTILSIFGLDEHVGELWRIAAHSAPGELPILTLARINRDLAITASAGFAVIVAVVTARPAAAALALLALASSRGFWNGLHSETPAPALWFAFVTATPAWCVLDDGANRPRGQLALALSSLTVSLGLAVAVRSEYVIVALPVVSVALIAAVFGGSELVALRFRLGAIGRRLWRAPWPVPFVMLAAVLAASTGIQALDFHSQLRAVGALPVLALQSPVALLGAVSAPVLALALLGLFDFARGGLARVAVPLALAPLMSVYLTASHGVGYEMSRYGTMAAMGFWLAALAGWLGLDRRADAAGWHPAWRGWFAAALVLAAATAIKLDPAGPGWWDALARTDREAPMRLVNRSLQREARVIVHSLSEAVHCLHVARARSRGEPREPLVLVTFSWHQPPMEEPDPATTVRDLRRRTAGCLRYVRSMDCNLLSAAGVCDADVRDAEALHVTQEPFAPYDDPTEYGEHSPVVRYGVWSIRASGP